MYSDGGAGENAHYIKALYSAFGIEHETGRPGNPQGRGVIERGWASHAIEVARANPLFRGDGVDRDTLRRNSIAVDKSIKAVKRGDTNVVPFAQLPPLSDMFAALAQAFDDYNNRPHRGLAKHPSEPRHYTPNEFAAIGRQHPDCAIETIDASAHRLMFMPHRIVETKRGRVTLFRQYYAHKDLYTLADGKSVKVHFDVTDPRAVWITDLDGRFLCEAGLSADTRDAFPVSVVEATRLRRIAGQAKRVAQKLDDLEQERAGIVQYSAKAFAPPDVLPAPEVEEFDREPDVAPKTDDGDAQNVVSITPVAAAARPIFRDPEDRYRWLMANRSQWMNADVKFVAQYVESPSYSDLREIFEREGIAWIDDDEAGESPVFRGAAA
jgi:putative transposase